MKRRKYLKDVAGGTVVLTSLLAGCEGLKGQPYSTPAPTESAESTGNGPPRRTGTHVTPDSSPGVGIYLGDEQALEPWEKWFGRTVDYYSIVVPKGGWDRYRVENMPLERPLREVGRDRELVVTFPMVPPEQSDLEAVAAGKHDEKYRRLGRDLIKHGQKNVNFRFGAEMNGDWGPDTAVNRPDTYVRAWRRVAAALDSVEDGSFRHIWAPTLGQKDLPPLEAYPGDEYVDSVGLTFYDRGWQEYPIPESCTNTCRQTRRRTMWDRFVSQEFGLDFWADFAREHEKPLVFPEYGIMPNNDTLYGGGDNPKFFVWFNEWMQANSDVVNWHNPWSWVGGPGFIGPAGLLKTEEYPANPDASERFKGLFNGD